MALFHLAVKAIGRSAGRNAVQAAAYRAGERLVCERTGNVFNYEPRHGVVATRIVVPQGETTIGRAQLWNAAEAAEHRCNSTVAREIEVALPHELDSIERKALAFYFAQQMAERYGVAVDVAIHEPSRRGDQRNYHAHCLMTTREIKPDGSVAHKVRRLDDRKTGPIEVGAIRTLWACACNDALAAAGVTATVDQRSHADRGLEATPGRKLGVGAVGFEQRTGMASRRRVDHEADAIAVEAAGRQAAQRDKAAHKVEPDGRQDAAQETIRRLRQRFGVVTQMILGGHHNAVIDKALTHAIARPSVTIRVASSHLRPQPSSALMRHASHSNAQQEKQASDHVWQRDREAEEAAATHRRVARELDAEYLAQIMRQNAELEQAARQTRPAVAVRPHPSELEKRIGRPEPRSEHEGASRPLYSLGEGDHSTVGSSLDGSDDDDADCGIDNPAVFASPSPLSIRQQLAIIMAKRLGEMHKRSSARLAQLAALSGLEVDALEAAALQCSPQAFDITLMADEPALARAWSNWMQADRDSHQRARAARDARSNDRDLSTVAKSGMLPNDGLQVATATPDELVKAGLESQSVVAAPVTNPSTTDDDTPMRPAFEKPETVASALPGLIPSPTARSGALDSHRRVMAADYYLWLRGRPDHLWSDDIAARIAAAIGIDPITLDEEARQRCRDRYGHDRPRQMTREQRMALVVEVTKAAGAAGFDELLSIRKLVLAASRRAREAAAGRPNQNQRSIDKGVGIA